ncbi:MAG: RDD family protein [Acidobacteriota bacterium]|nr:RDD family protein [Acidobacteriota bacterium]
MINDTVREELKPKSLSLPKRVNFDMKGNSSVSNKLNQQVITSNQPKPADLPKPIELKPTTTEIASKPVIPNLVEFHTKTATVPEWRLQLQNAVRQRQGCGETNKTDEPAAVRQTKLATSVANALKADVVVEVENIQHENTTLNSALQRIEESRQKFLQEEIKSPIAPVNPVTATNKQFPFYIASKQTEVAANPASKNVPVSVPTKPKLATSLRTDSEPLDTNKLPPLPKPAKISSSFAKSSVNFLEAENKIETKPVETGESIEASDEEIYEEIDDCAPFAMRFNAGLFDLIIGGFFSLLLLAPFVMLGGSWFTFAGLFAFLAICAIVMFIYLTTSISLFGRTFGMRLFSLEMVDIEGEEYPTLHQAAVSSSVYLLSLALGGIGFLTLPFNEEKRAVHDLVSGTIVVREF